MTSEVMVRILGCCTFSFGLAAGGCDDDGDDDDGTSSTSFPLFPLSASPLLVDLFTAFLLSIFFSNSFLPGTKFTFLNSKCLSLPCVVSSTLLNPYILSCLKMMWDDIIISHNDVSLPYKATGFDCFEVSREQLVAQFINILDDEWTIIPPYECISLRSFFVYVFYLFLFLFFILKISLFSLTILCNFFKNGGRSFSQSSTRGGLRGSSGSDDASYSS